MTAAVLAAVAAPLTIIGLTRHRDLTLLAGIALAVAALITGTDTGRL